MQNLLFCVPKAAVLHGKSVGFASQNSRFRNAKAQLSLFNRIIFTKLSQKAFTAPLTLCQVSTSFKNDYYKSKETKPCMVSSLFYFHFPAHLHRNYSS
ncbi:hypothetical protein CTI16_00690 [Prevotella intermedia]|uniref:Uncharacterized protein n=1 Tax=Prevotella intermedia TaxID=28131 RepID=A0AAJ3RI49_PREIN|nr:hypothetical protein CTI16_00690 [Prevotella intermedia]